MTVEQAVVHILSGTDMGYRITGACPLFWKNKAPLPRSTQFQQTQYSLIPSPLVTVSNSQMHLFETPGFSVYLSAERIEIVKGTSPGDFLPASQMF